MFVSAIIAAAGSSRRMGDDKLLIPIEGVPTVVMSVAAFENCPDINEMVIVTRAEKISVFEKLFSEAGFSKPIKLVEGADTRQGSVINGLAAVSENSDYIAIHDGARPLVTPAQISACIASAVKYGAAALGSKVKDTIKQVDSDNIIEKTIDRSLLWAVHTPQIFEAKLYRKAMQNAADNGKDYTDDCQLVEAVGQRVYMEFDGYENLKLTTPEDVLIAEAIVKRRKAICE
ncbi:MAG: 2-C-methyl-D-erythritol 4-phosphate cytidylyltransferase [Oscillospiraceae bacterium]|nr:2-C-methyl-D-erythritol 4-phosphate cytidylyltransferase [Oscillospiraceae bacterium]